MFFFRCSSLKMLVSLVLLLLVSSSAIGAQMKQSQAVQEGLAEYEFSKVLHTETFRADEELQITSDDEVEVQSHIQLRILRYPTSCGSAMSRFVINRFEENNPNIKIDIKENPSTDVYNLENIKKIFGPTGPDAFDVVEVDTVLLGEIVEAKLLQPIEIDTRRFLTQAASAVTYKSKPYGLPTVVCSNFLVTTTNPKGTGSNPLIGNFRGSWTLADYYLNAYIDKHGPHSVYKGVDSNPCEEREVLGVVRNVFDTCKKSNGKNPCTESLTTKELIDEVAGSKECTFLGHSETIGEALMKNPLVRITSIQAPPLAIGDKPRHSLLHTDAVVMNRHLDKEKRTAAQKFIDYYTSTEVRLELAFCKGTSKKHCIQYELPAMLEFYESPRLKGTLFQKFRSIIDNELSVFGPNHKFYYKKDDIAKSISKCLVSTTLKQTD